MYKHYSKSVIHKRYLKFVISGQQTLLKISNLQALFKILLKISATRGYDLTSEPQKLEAKLPLSYCCLSIAQTNILYFSKQYKLRNASIHLTFTTSA